VSASLERFLAAELAARGRSAWTTAPLVTETATPGRAVIDGRERLLLCTNDYLGLAADPRVVEAAREAAARFGAGSRAARSLAGDTTLHGALERELADFKGTEAALLFGSGFSCNSAVISALTEAGDVIISDELNHASIVDGCRLSPARVRVYRHGDLESLDAVLSESADAVKRMIVTDAVFSMDGDVAPLPGILERAARHDAFVMLDEAHATGVLGPGGEGSLEHFGLDGGVAVLMGTLGKSLGSVGGFVAGRRDLVDFLATHARGFLFTTSLAPASVGAALEALRILRAEPARVQRLWSNARRLHAGLAGLGFTVAAEPAPILPVFTSEASAVSAELYTRDVVAHAIATPYVPPGTERIRLIASAAHSDADIDAILAAFGALAPA
jgi:8-amino-7-oxononanoate synthase